MLKTLGFTPGQVVRMLLAEQTALGVAGTALGLAAARLATSPAFVHPDAQRLVGVGDRAIAAGTTLAGSNRASTSWVPVRARSWAGTS